MRQVLAVRDSATWPLLNITASRGHERLVRRLLEYGCPVDSPDAYGSTPLYRAVGFRQNHVVRVLLAAGADICHINKVRAGGRGEQRWGRVRILAQHMRRCSI
jgi:ankyrin repeat protein